MIAFIREMRWKPIFTTTSNYPMRRFVFDRRDAIMTKGNDLREPRSVAVVTGCGSYLIKRGFFDESLWDYSNAPQAAFYKDDIWISGWLARRNVKRYAIPTSAMMRSVWRQRRTLSMHDVPNGRQQKIAFFRDNWDVFALH